MQPSGLTACPARPKTEDFSDIVEEVPKRSTFTRAVIGIETEGNSTSPAAVTFTLGTSADAQGLADACAREGLTAVTAGHTVKVKGPAFTAPAFKKVPKLSKKQKQEARAKERLVSQRAQEAYNLQMTPPVEMEIEVQVSDEHHPDHKHRKRYTERKMKMKYLRDQGSTYEYEVRLKARKKAKEAKIAKQDAERRAEGKHLRCDRDTDIATSTSGVKLKTLLADEDVALVAARFPSGVQALARSGGLLLTSDEVAELDDGDEELSAEELKK